MRELAGALEDASFATAIYAKGKRMLEARADAWVPRITLLAAHRIKRSEEFLPTYEGFLGWMDTQPKKDWHLTRSIAAIKTKAATFGSVPMEEGQVNTMVKVLRIILQPRVWPII